MRGCVCTRKVSCLCVCISILQASIRNISSRLFLCRIRVAFSRGYVRACVLVCVAVCVCGEGKGDESVCVEF